MDRARDRRAAPQGLPSLCFCDSVDCVGRCVAAICLSVQKIPETKELLGPRGALWCLHLHINERLWCTLETTKTLSSLRE